MNDRSGDSGDSNPPRPGRVLLDQHLRAVREQIAAVHKQQELERDLLEAARPEFERRCERDGVCHRSAVISTAPPVTLTCEVIRNGVRLDSPAYHALPEWLMAEGRLVDQLVIRAPFTHNDGAAELVSALPEEVLHRCFRTRWNYDLPDEILAHPDCHDPAVQQHVAQLVAQGLLKVDAELLEIELRSEYALEPGSHELQALLDDGLHERCFEVRQVWLAPADVGDYKYSRDARQWAGFRLLESLGTVSLQYSVRFSA